MRNIARIVNALVQISESIITILTLGFYYPNWSVKTVIFFAKKGFYS